MDAVYVDPRFALEARQARPLYESHKGLAMGCTPSGRALSKPRRKSSTELALRHAGRRRATLS